MIILGINADHGDAAAALVVDGKLVGAIEEERLNRIKHSAGIPARASREVLAQAGISPEAIDYLTTSRNPSANLLAKFQFIFKSHPPLSYLKERLSVAIHSGKKISGRSGLNLTYRDNQEQTSGLLRRSTPRNDIVRVEHHLSHAASAYYPSGFERAALLTVDGFGDFSSVMFGTGEGNRIKVLKRVLFPHSLGVLYTAATQFIGFLKYGDEYKVMGLAGWGEPRFLQEFRELIPLESDGTFRLNLDYFLHPHGRSDMTWEEGEPVLSPLYSDKWTSLFGKPRHPEEPLTQRDKDLAASMQTVFEETYFHLMNHLYRETRMDSLCLAGGCAMNSVANGKIFQNSPFKNVYIQPAAGDAGTALGSALYLAHHRLNQPRDFVMNHVYWGPEFGETAINEELKMKNEELKKEGCEIRRIENENVLCRETAKAIAEGKIIGWFQGRMELGSRALGNRSILADPRRSDIKDTLNTRIKHRESFRPFAPSVLEEKAGDWFEMGTAASPFMNLVFPVRPEKKDKIPAVTHVDGTARVHTVTKQANPLFWTLIDEFNKITGVPMVLNTSFNENEPIVCTPQDALNSFLRTKMDILVVGPYRIERKES